MEITLSLPMLLFLMLMTGFAGFVDSAAGGGGLISLPAYLFAGLPVHYTYGTNKFSAACGTTFATASFFKNGAMNVKVGILAAIGSFAGSALGAHIVLLLSDEVLKTTMFIILPIAAVIILWQRNLPDENRDDGTMNLKKAALALGIGLGSVLAFVIVQLNAMAGNPAMSIGALLALYAAFALLLGLGGYLIAPRAIDSITRLIALVERCMDKMTFEQQAGSISGLVGGFIIAALLSQLVMLMGASMFTVAMCAILFVVFGVLGVTLGIRRAADFKRMFQRFSPKGNKQVALSHRKIKTAKPKLLDETVLIDGRIAAVCRAGFLEGTLLISRSVEKELQRLSASEEETCRIRGEKGRETLSQLEALGRVKRVDSAAGGELAQVLLADAKKHHMVIVTCDAAMSRTAEKAGVAALNLNDLACALRPMVQMGDLLDVRIVKAGREATQGVGYTPDGTMVVVEGGRDAVGQVLHVQVSSVLQTNAGRMIFAKKV